MPVAAKLCKKLILTDGATGMNRHVSLYFGDKPSAQTTQNPPEVQFFFPAMEAISRQPQRRGEDLMQGNTT
ncbi:hypothetical protein [uncultured Tateyamaria sp.]|uniref:hypothetical protein n=1 Tax=uncultured Tateyamaria sp. TaxID=455651 RepID=UPI0026227979|nr:hypothetical protein [uncultured Tateyamaria sp.]